MKLNYVTKLADDFEAALRNVATQNGGATERQLQEIACLMVSIHLCELLRTDLKIRPLKEHLEVELRNSRLERRRPEIDRLVSDFFGKSVGREAQRMVFNELYNRMIKGGQYGDLSLSSQLLEDIIAFLSIPYEAIDFLTTGAWISSDLSRFIDVRGRDLKVRFPSGGLPNSGGPLHAFAMLANGMHEYKDNRPRKSLIIIHIEGMDIYRYEQLHMRLRNDGIRRDDGVLLIGRKVDFLRMSSRSMFLNPAELAESMSAVFRFSGRRKSGAHVYAVYCKEIGQFPRKDQGIAIIDCIPLDAPNSWASREVKALALWMALRKSGICEDAKHGNGSESPWWGAEAIESAQVLANRLLSAAREHTQSLIRIMDPHTLRESIEKHNYESLYPDTESLYDPIFSNKVDTQVIMDSIQKESKSNNIFIIGDNGSGKSFLLRDIQKKLSQGGRSVYSLSGASPDRFRSSHGSYKNLGAISRLASRDASLRTMVLQLPEIKEQILLDLMGRAGFSRELFLSARGLNASSPFVNGDDGVVRLSGESPKASVISSLPDEFIQKCALAVRKENSRDIVRCSDLSSGERAIMALIICLASISSPDSVILIDEPENCLHVSWQKLIPSILRKVEEEFQTTCIVATHSPILIREGMSCGASSFRLQDHLLTIINENISNSIGSVYFNDFRVIIDGDEEVKKTCGKILSEAVIQWNGGNGVFDCADQIGSVRSIIRRNKDRNLVESQSDVDMIDAVEMAIKKLNEPRG